MTGPLDKVAAGNANLLLLAEILENADAEHVRVGEPTYDQGITHHACGTPACAGGHWLVYRKIAMAPSTSIFGRQNADTLLLDFCLHDEAFDELFGAQGCGRARNSTQAAAYIRDFVWRRSWP